MYNKVILALRCNTEAKTATIYMSPHFTIKATRRRKLDKRDKSSTYIVTAGIPNYLERKFIRLLIKSKTPFPVRKVQLKLYPVKKSKT